MPIKIPFPTETKESVHVPAGNRSKCRTCGAVDNIKLSGINRVKRCGACGSTIAMRRAPRKPNIKSFRVIFQLNGENIGQSEHVTQSSAEYACRNFVEFGPVAHTRIALLVELLDNESTGNVRQLRYDNYRGKRQAITWTSGCSQCKGRGSVAVSIPIRSDNKNIIRFVACGLCNGLGGELTREINYRRLKRAS